MNDLFDKPHVKNHRWFKNLKADSAAKEKRLAKHAQSLDLGDSTGKPNLSDMFSSANRLGLLNNSKKLPDLIKTAILTAREAIDQFDFPISPSISYLNVKNVKTAGTTDDVLSGTIMLLCKFATVGGLKQAFDVPIQVVSGKILPPSVIRFQGRDIVLAQSSVNAMVQRASSYELIPVRKQFSAPFTRDERESATELRNEIGYQAREGIGPISVCKRTYSKTAQEYVSAIPYGPSAEGNDYEFSDDGKEVFYAVEHGNVEDVREALNLSSIPENELYYCWLAAKEDLGKEDVAQELVKFQRMTFKKKDFDKESDAHSDYPVSDTSDLTDKITPNEPMADMDDAKKYQNPPLRARKAQNEFLVTDSSPSLDSDDADSDLIKAVKDWDSEKVKELVSSGKISVGEWEKAMTLATTYGMDDVKRQLIRYRTKALPESGKFLYKDVDENTEEDSDIDLNHWAKKAQEDDEDDFYHTFKDWAGGHQASRTASMGTAVPGGYEKVKGLMDKAQDEGKDTFPRSWIHVLRNYILEVVATASQDSWLTHLVNDGYVLNPYGSNNRGREKTAQMGSSDLSYDEIVRRITENGSDVNFFENKLYDIAARLGKPDPNASNALVQFATKFVDKSPISRDLIEGALHSLDNLIDDEQAFAESEGRLDSEEQEESNAEMVWVHQTLDEVLNEGFDKGAQVEDEWNDEVVMDEPESHIYDGTKTPMEPGDSVKFQGHEGPIRGTIVEVNKAAGNAIVKAKGYEYRVALEDIQPLNSTFKKMYANNCIRLLPPEKKYAQIFNNLTKDPSIDDPWAATWDARDKDIHSGPKETKNKDVKPIVKGYGKKSHTPEVTEQERGLAKEPIDQDEITNLLRKKKPRPVELDEEGNEYPDPFEKMLEYTAPQGWNPYTTNVHGQGTK